MSIWLCAPPPAVGPPGGRRVKAHASGKHYTLNQFGCGLIDDADVPFFLSQGWLYPGGTVIPPGGTAITSAAMAAWFSTLPTSPAGLPAGTPYNNGNTLGFA